MYCLNNVVTRFRDNFYVQKDGIVTGDNHSVSLANIAVHFVILPIARTLKKAELFKRFIDDIIWFSYGENATECIENALTAAFQEYDLELVFRKISTDDSGQTLEFLDVCHEITGDSQKGFVTMEFVKPTSVDRCFLHGASHHPPSVYKGIVFGEAVRMRRLNERKEDYLKSLQKIEK